MREIRASVFLISSVVLLLFFSSTLLIAQHQIPIGVISNGGEVQSNTSYSLVGSVGQASIDQCSNALHQLQMGFWGEYLTMIIVSVKDEEMLPAVYKLEQNYPNPFNPTTIIKFAVPQRSNVLIKIYDILGGEVNTLVNEELEPGWYERQFNAIGYASGVYIYRMEAGTYVSNKKMLLVK